MSRGICRRRSSKSSTLVTWRPRSNSVVTSSWFDAFGCPCVCEPAGTSSAGNDWVTERRLPSDGRNPDYTARNNAQCSMLNVRCRIRLPLNIEHLSSNIDVSAATLDTMELSLPLDYSAIE